VVDVEVTVAAVPDVDAWIAELRPALLRTLAPIGEVLRESTDSCFDRQSDPWGTAWPSTRRSRSGEGRILIDRGILRGSIHVEMDESTLTVRVAAGGAAASYAFVHQWGSEAKGIEARPFLALRGSAGAPFVELPADVQAEVEATVRDALDQYVARMNAQRSSAPGGT
jgi:phage virion morphogenesis protein